MCRFAADLLPTLRIIAGKNTDRLKLDTKVGSSLFTLLLLLNFNLHVFFSVVIELNESYFTSFWSDQLVVNHTLDCGQVKHTHSITEKCELQNLPE